VIKPADLAWRGDQPFSAAYGDIYHSSDGPAEVERVFLKPAGFADLLARRTRITVGELGFGTGLNFAVVARHCLAAGVDLHFVSVDSAPISPAMFSDICRARRLQEPIYAELPLRYPPLVPGWHRRRMHQGRVTLSVFWGEASAGLAEITDTQREPFDLWLLDGFAPDRNPDMWEANLLAQMAQVSTRGTGVTTFTAAGRVRRALSAAGFQMRRVDQQPYKHESLAGIFEPPGMDRYTPATQARIVGAGLAGASAARELAESGISVQVIESAQSIATGASSIPVTLMHPRLHPDGSAISNLKAATYAHALAACQPYLRGDSSTGVRTTGALQLASTNFPDARLAAVAAGYTGSGIRMNLLTPDQTNEVAGIPLNAPALWFPDACLVSGPELCATLLDHPLIEVCTGIPLSDWPEGVVILACGAAAQHFPGAGYLELGIVHGQLDRVRAQRSPLTELKVPVVGDGYLVPEAGPDSLVGAGATYEYAPWPEGKASARNFGYIDRIAAGSFTPHSRHRGARCVSSDRNPVIGPLYSFDRRECVDRLVSTGHGSMGTVTSHLGAALVDASLNGNFPPLAKQQQQLVSPLRFRVRQSRRGYRFGARA